MSYDLYLKPHRGDFDPADVAGYFNGRSHYTMHGTQAVYQNEDTGVYFSFDTNEQTEDDEPGADYPILFNINFYRPSYFILEAEPEVTALVKEFDAAVFDPQHHGMGEGPYNWAKGHIIRISLSPAGTMETDFHSVRCRKKRG